MAEELGLSPSYLNLMERNQRPITAQVLIRLAHAYQLDPREFKGAWVALVDRMLVEFDATEHARLWRDRRREAIALRRTAEVVDRLRHPRRPDAPRQQPDPDGGDTGTASNEGR